MRIKAYEFRVIHSIVSTHQQYIIYITAHRPIALYRIVGKAPEGANIDLRDNANTSISKQLLV